MTTVEWVIASPPPRPTIFASVKTAEWETTAETTHGNVTLSVVRNSLLILTCVASYPIIWKKRNQVEPPAQVLTYNPYFEKPDLYKNNARNYSVRNEYEIPAIQNYTSRLELKNFSQGVVYVCETNSLKAGLLRSTVNLELSKIPDFTHDYAEVVQASFDTIRPQPSYFFRYWDTKLSFPFIYYIPPNANVTQALDGSDPNIEWSIKQPKWGQKEENFHIYDFVQIYPRLLTQRLGLTTFVITRGSYAHKGTYDFILRTHFENGTRVERRCRFYLWLDTIEYSVEAAEALTPFNSSALLTIGEMYEIRLYTSNINLTNARLLVQKQVQQESECVAENVPSEDVQEICGVFGVSLFNDTLPSSPETGVQVFLYVRRACILSVLLEDQKKIKGISPSLHIAALERDVFEEKRDGAILTSDPELGSDNVIFTNESIKLRCLIPACHLFYIVWCGDMCQWPPFNYKNEGPSMIGQMADAEISFANYSIHTISSDAYFPSLQKNHTGLYYCGLLPPSSRKQHIVHSDKVELKMKVLDPIRPYFADGRNFAVVKTTIRKGSTLPLLCVVNGLPKPNVTWTWQLEPGENYHVRDGDTPENNTSFITDQAGTYICNATSKYGSNWRTFVVEYEAENLYTPFAIAVPVAVLVVAGAVLAYWWMKKRAVQASFKELARALQESKEDLELDNSTCLNDQVQFLQYNRSLEIDRNRFVVTSKLLGMGEFGCIYKGELKIDDADNVQEVAVKEPRDSFNLRQFRALADELKVMSHIRPHVNVLMLVGACTQNVEQRQLFVLTEFCENGSLKDYLIKNSMKFEGFEVNSTGQFLGAPGAVEALLKYAYQAANGMAYLAAEKILHRDLALRNLLLTGNHIVRVSDFGMSRQHTANAVYRRRLSADIMVPLFWMAIESLADGQYTRTSDVWSFGVVLWEMFSCGRQPYPDHEPNPGFRTWLMEKEGNRMGPPKIACDEIYKLMRSCWKENPEARPSFSECKRNISRILEQRSSSVYQSMVVSLSDAWLSVNPTSISKVSDPNDSSVRLDSMRSDSSASVNAYVSVESPRSEVVSPDMESMRTNTRKKSIHDYNASHESVEMQGAVSNPAHFAGDDSTSNVGEIAPRVDTPYNTCRFIDPV